MYMAMVGQSPLQTDRNRKIRFAVLIVTNISLLLPSLFQLFKSLLDNDPDGMMDCVPVLVTLIVCMTKLVNHNKNREEYKRFFKLVHGEWIALRFSNEISVLNKVASQGSNIALLYRSEYHSCNSRWVSPLKIEANFAGTLLAFVMLFLLIPLTPIFLDVVLPLNETRPRRHIFQLNYIFVDTDECFYPIYLHMAWSTFSNVMIIIAIDSLYMVFVHHTCGLFAICGYQIKQATEGASGTVDLYQHFKQYAIGHNKAIQLYELIGNSNRNSYLLQVGLNMVAISVTAVQILMHLDQPAEVFRIAMFLSAQKFHLLVLSLPGQALVDYSLGLANDIYASKWYQTPVKIQKMLYVMKIKSSRPCMITAGGLYQMNIENFGMIVKSCVSYFMMLTSLRE
ncbi:odorant receptor 9a-like isoform X2 [Andrena cerasifolii]|uniref:odorant receptor 9a-like isoform X2 n=1 Tax=Andrena cerasifolii TaxID=2819439 RepID=UPI00403813DE